MSNAADVLAFHRKHRNALAPGYFQRSDRRIAPMHPENPGIVHRHLGAFNEGLADVAGFPVDLVNGGLNLLGLPVSDRPVLGSEWIRDGLHRAGIGQFDDRFTPRSGLERYTQAAARGVGQAVVPFGGMTAAAGRSVAQGASAATRASAARSAARNLLADAARRPGVAAAAELGAGVGSGTGGQVAADYAPGNRWAQMAGQMIGGGMGGVAGGVPASRRPFGGAPRIPPPPTGFTELVADGWHAPELLRYREVLPSDAYGHQQYKKGLYREEIMNPGEQMRGPVLYGDPVKGATAEQRGNLREYVDIANLVLDEGGMSPTGRVSTIGQLEKEAAYFARREKEKAAAAGRSYKGVAAHGPDTTWTGQPDPFFWLDHDSSINSSIGGQSRNYPIGFKPTRFLYEGDL
jgi:hypothetical protein